MTKRSRLCASKERAVRWLKDRFETQELKSLPRRQDERSSSAGFAPYSEERPGIAPGEIRW